MKRALVFPLALALTFGLFAFSACGLPERGHLITVQNENGVVLSEKRAKAGELVTLSPEEAGYTLRAVYINGEKIAGGSFLMPDGDVTALVVLESTSDRAHEVAISETGELGRTVADRARAEAGETVTLTTFVGYGNHVKGYLVNGEPIEGNSFAMPDGDAVVSAVYEQILRPSEVVFTVEQSYERATSHWYAGYTDGGLTVEIAVEDNILFTDKEYVGSVAYGDNVEFILGKRTGATGLDSTRYKVLVGASGEYLFEHYQNGWRAAGELSVSVTHCTLEEHGFHGYLVNVYVPYLALGTDAAEGFGAISVAPAMRNTLNGLKSAWSSFSGLRCNWNDMKTHLLVTADGSFAQSEVKGGTLFVGDGLLSLSGWGNFYGDLDGIGSVYSVAQSGRDAAFWADHISLIAEYAPESVYFSASVAGRSVMAAFSDFRRFAEAFFAELPETSLTVISPLPTLFEEPQKAAAYGESLKDYLLDSARYIDLCGAVLEGGTPNRNLYASESALSEDGYALLGKLIRTEAGVYGGDKGQTWGDSGNYVSSGAWTENGDLLTLRSGGTRKIYYRTPLTGDFELRIEVSALEIYNQDGYPKFGFTVQDGALCHAFYISAENGLTAQRAGVVSYAFGQYDWANSLETNVKDLRYTNGNYATLRLVRAGKTLSFFVNDTQVYAGTPEYRGSLVVGLFAFNTALNFRNCTVIGGNA